MSLLFDLIGVLGFSCFVLYRHVELRIELEMDRREHYLDESTQKALIHVVEKHLLADHISVILDKGFNELCDEVRLEDLTRLYQMFGRVNQHEGNDAFAQLTKTFVNYINRKGSSIVLNPDQDDYMVQSLLDFKQTLDKILKEAFAENESLVKAEKQSFEQLINMRKNKPAELIARFIDQILKTGNKKYSEDELKTTLDRLMSLFRFIYAKDIFEAFYKKDLSKRLLFDRSASLDLENEMISKLKIECGSAFTNKLEGMFKDVNLSTDIMHSFQENRRSASKLGSIDLKVNVLTTSYWPTMSNQEIKLPPELIHYQEIFKDFYLHKYQGRVLTWQYGFGMVTLTANFPKRKHYLSVSLYQTVVLLLFNDADMLTYSEVEEGSGLTGAELERALLSLSCGKHRVLLKNPKGPKISKSDTFTYAKDFCKQLVQLKINSIQMQATPEENQQTTERVFQERKEHIDAAIVRIMKMRKVMLHKHLITELFEQIKFPYRPSALKSRIEALIDKEYLERDETNPDKYRYLA